jgi:hypothetical protein
MKAFVMKGISSVGFIERQVASPGPNGAIVETRALIRPSDRVRLGATTTGYFGVKVLITF